MHAYPAGVQNPRLSEREKLSMAAAPLEGPRPAELCFEAGLALFIPLVLALAVELCRPGMPGPPFLYGIYMEKGHARGEASRVFASTALSAHVFDLRVLSSSERRR